MPHKAANVVTASCSEASLSVGAWRGSSLESGTSLGSALDLHRRVVNDGQQVNPGSQYHGHREGEQTTPTR